MRWCRHAHAHPSHTLGTPIPETQPARAQVEAEHNAALDACDMLRDRMGEVAEYVSLATAYRTMLGKAAAARAAAAGAPRPAALGRLTHSRPPPCSATLPRCADRVCPPAVRSGPHTEARCAAAGRRRRAVWRRASESWCGGGAAKVGAPVRARGVRRRGSAQGRRAARRARRSARARRGSCWTGTAPTWSLPTRPRWKRCRCAAGTRTTRTSCWARTCCCPARARAARACSNAPPCAHGEHPLLCSCGLGQRRSSADGGVTACGKAGRVCAAPAPSDRARTAVNCAAQAVARPATARTRARGAAARPPARGPAPDGHIGGGPAGGLPELR